MLTEICEYLHNWFCENRSDKVIGTITVRGGEISVPYGVLPRQGQYIRIIGSVFNDGVWKYGDAEFSEETFEGAVWYMRVPQVFIDLVTEIEDWQAKYGGADSAAMSPYNSESFAGYSYSKSAGAVSADGTLYNPNTWKTTFSARLSRWRKL